MGAPTYVVADAKRVDLLKRTFALGKGTKLSSNTNAIVHFVECLEKGLNPPESLCNLSMGNEAALADALVRDVLINTFRLQQRVYYLIEPRLQPTIEDAPWQLVVQSAATAVECLRRCTWGLLCYSIVREFLMRGIPFNTYVPLPANAPTPCQSIFHLHPPERLVTKPTLTTTMSMKHN